MRAAVGILTHIHEEALRNRNTSTHAAVLEAASVFAALIMRDPPQDAQQLLVEAFALAGSINSDHAVACILSRVPDGCLPSPPLLLAAASCASLCGTKFDPHMPTILSKIVPCISVAKSDSTRAVIATLAARFSECAASSRCALALFARLCTARLTTLQGRWWNCNVQQRTRHYLRCNGLWITMQFRSWLTVTQVRTWLPSLRTTEAREAVCESVGHVAGVVSPDVVEPVLSMLMQFLTSTMRSASKDVAKHVISKSLALIIEAVASSCGKAFMM